MMTLENIKNQSILISPLDWGFGHTTRCVPIINQLLKNNNQIVFAGNKAQIKFIKIEFPEITTEFIEGYNIKLSSKKNTYIQLVQQGKSILNTIKNENNWVAEFISSNAVDVIISDNRYGFRHQKIKSIFIGHQLNLIVPYFKSIVNSRLIKHINKFNYCWIFDDEKINLAGNLSHPKNLKIPYTYLGLHTRFTILNLPVKYDYLVVVSGPKPENELFLQQIEEKLKSLTQFKVGIVSTVKSLKELNHIDYFYNPITTQLNQLINQSTSIISRSGYTTLMDLFLLKKAAILIPTKGQYEQEYLAKSIEESGFTFVNSVGDLKP